MAREEGDNPTLICQEENGFARNTTFPLDSFLLLFLLGLGFGGRLGDFFVLGTSSLGLARRSALIATKALISKN